MKRFLPLAFGGLFLLAGAGCIPSFQAGSDDGDGSIACTQEAMVCPDGSAVGRTGPDCQFAPCPPSTTSDCSGPGGKCQSGYTCIEECGPPVARENDPPPGYYCERNDIASQPRTCPICLASNTRIDTPNGEVNVTKLTVGEQVWSVNADGERIISTIIKVSHTPVPSNHHVTHLILVDGREVLASPNHPTTNGLVVGDLKAGDIYNGVMVRSAEREAYADDQTYDLLPDSDTGFYWANGILLGSTLVK